MTFSIPLHSLVVVLSHGQPWTQATAPNPVMAFAQHEVVSAEATARALFGNDSRPEHAQIIHDELRRCIALKLSFGQRVLLWAIGMSTEDRCDLARSASAQGASIYYLIDQSADLRALQGDYLGATLLPAEVAIDACFMPNGALLQSLSRRYRGITVAGDLHGDLAALEAVAAWAESRDHYLYLLGDVLDYGPLPLETTDAVYTLVMAGRAGLLLGNHERKIARWLQAHAEGRGRGGIKLSEGNRVTTDALDRLSATERGRWFGRFRALLAQSSLIAHLGPLTLAHGGLHPDLWRPASQQNFTDIENYALFGEGEPFTRDGQRQYRLSYRWVDQVPAGNVVIVGHDQRSSVPKAVRGARGGNVVFLDTGCGKGGTLSSADLRFTDAGSLRLENFNRHDP